jgi:hypothetical protein
MKKFLFAVVVLGLLVAGCSQPADVASRNISTAADNFEVVRRIVFYNGITNQYILVIEGYCSLGNNDQPGELSVICKLEDNSYVKHFLGLSDNVTYFAEQIEPSQVSEHRYKVIFRPETIVPDVEIR